MKSTILLAMLVIGFASCDTPSTAAGSEAQADSSAMNKMSTDSGATKMSTDTSNMKKDTSTMKKDSIPK